MMIAACLQGIGGLLEVHVRLEPLGVLREHAQRFDL
jgi:hypothetical protein